MARPRKSLETVAEDTDPTAGFQLTPAEMQAILELRRTGTQLHVQESLASKEPEEQKFGVEELAKALVSAIESTRPPQKKTVANRRKLNPWTPKDGSPKILKFKRPMYHHGIPLNPKTTLNENCVLLDKLKPGIYCNGHVRVTKRRDNGLDIDYPIRTAAQRLKLTNQFGITSFNSLLQRIVDERNDPRKYATPEELEDLE